MSSFKGFCLIKEKKESIQAIILNPQYKWTPLNAKEHYEIKLMLNDEINSKPKIKEGSSLEY